MEGTERQQEETLRSVGQWNGILEDERMPKPKRKTFLPPAQRGKRRKSLQKNHCKMAKTTGKSSHKRYYCTMYVAAYTSLKSFFSFCRRECNLFFARMVWFSCDDKKVGIRIMYNNYSTASGVERQNTVQIK